MKLSPPGTIPRLSASALPFSRFAPVFACVLASCAVAMSGCGGATSPSSSSSSSSSSDSSPVIVGTQPNSLPTPPQQTDVNLYAGLDVQGNVDMIYYVSQPNQSYYFQQPGASGTRNGGIFTTLGDLEELSQTDGQNSAYTLAGFSTEIEGGIAILE